MPSLVTIKLKLQNELKRDSGVWQARAKADLRRPSLLAEEAVQARAQVVKVLRTGI
ncbi:MAG: hypothetical protein IPJ98_05410 [Bryobacterales bacterium]|nr:hypothetical protein [Bryobacterales bacterium]